MEIMRCPSWESGVVVFLVIMVVMALGGSVGDNKKSPSQGLVCVSVLKA